MAAVFCHNADRKTSNLRKTGLKVSVETLNAHVMDNMQIWTDVSDKHVLNFMCPFDFFSSNAQVLRSYMILLGYSVADQLYV